ncbi:helix-turn-helix domain-containing protein [Larkinella harenae]
MAKEKIQIYSIAESLTGVEIFHLSDPTALELGEERALIPHRHDHYFCFLLEEGVLNFSVDFQNLEIQASSLLVSCPGQVHQTGYARDVAGWILVFDARFIDINARMVIEQSLAKVALLQLECSEQEWITGVFRLMQSTLHEKRPESFYPQLLQTLVNAFFYKAVSLFQLQETKRIQEYSLRSIEIAKTFQQLVKEHFFTSKKPADYASKMNLTVSYLNDTVKSVTGFPSTYFIQHEIIREAQRLLFYTAKSVKEIAFQLGYEDHKYFIRLFSKTAGISPANFRKTNKQ